jgi:hypothetical protein
MGTQVCETSPLDENGTRSEFPASCSGLEYPSSGKYSKRFLKNGAILIKKNFQIPAENGSLEAVFEDLVFR